MKSNVCKIFVLGFGLSLFASAASAQGIYNDGHNREWRPLTATTGLNWQQIASVCPPGVVCSGTVGGRDLSGWHWASQADVRLLFSYSVPQILVTPNLFGSAYFVPALVFVEAIGPTDAVYQETYNTEYLGGRTSTKNPDGTVVVASVSSSWPVFNGTWTTVSSASETQSSPYVGVWLWRWIVEPCRADFDGDGFVTGDDFDAYVLAFEAGSSSADFDGDTFVTGEDFDLYVAAFETGC